MVPGVGLNGGAPHLSADCLDSPGEEPFYTDHDEQYCEGPWGRGMVRRVDLPDRCECDDECGTEEHDRDDRPGEWFSFAVAEWVLLIGLATGEVQAAPDDQR